MQKKEHEGTRRDEGTKGREGTQGNTEEHDRTPRNAEERTIEREGNTGRTRKGSRDTRGNTKDEKGKAKSSSREPMHVRGSLAERNVLFSYPLHGVDLYECLSWLFGPFQIIWLEGGSVTFRTRDPEPKPPPVGLQVLLDSV
jgi:hypothetical protein